MLIPINLINALNSINSSLVNNELFIFIKCSDIYNEPNSRMNGRINYYQSSPGDTIYKWRIFAPVKESLSQHFRELHGVEKAFLIDKERELSLNKAQKKGLKNEKLISHYIIASRDITYQEVCNSPSFFPITSCVKCRKRNTIAHVMKKFQTAAIFLDQMWRLFAECLSRPFLEA